MTVEAYLKSLVQGLSLDPNVLARAARSPKEVGLAPLHLDDDIDAFDDDPIFDVRLDYAVSTVYYSVVGMFAGGGYTEQIGDVRVSQGSYTITTADRRRLQALADNLRRKHGFVIEGATEEGGMFDAGYLRAR